MLVYGALLDAIRRQRAAVRATQPRRRVFRAKGKREIAAAEFAAYPCVQLCPDCGWFDWDAEFCRECGQATHDLRREDIAEFHRDETVASAQEPSETVSNVSQRVGLVSGAGLGALAGILFAGASGGASIFGLAGLLVGAYAGYLLGPEAARPVMGLLPGAKERAQRWFEPDESDADPGILTSPFSQQSCRAYRIRVLLAVPEALRVTIPVIDESRGRSDATLSLPTTPIEPDRERLARYLRERGLHISDGDWRVWEAVA